MHTDWIAFKFIAAAFPLLPTPCPFVRLWEDTYMPAGYLKFMCRDTTLISKIYLLKQLRRAGVEKKHLIGFYNACI